MSKTTARATARRAGVVIAGAALTVGLGMIFPGAAQASRSQCVNESGWLCFWQHPNFSGKFGKVENRNFNWGEFNGGCSENNRRWSNCASSIRNEGLSCEAVVYDGINLTGASWVINRETEADDLTEWGMPGSDNWNDKISSNDWWCG